jgi:hypothetical protein
MIWVTLLSYFVHTSLSLKGVLSMATVEVPATPEPDNAPELAAGPSSPQSLSPPPIPELNPRPRVKLSGPSRFDEMGEEELVQEVIAMVNASQCATKEWGLIMNRVRDS